MTLDQYQFLLNTLSGKVASLRPAFIIDSPWLPNWAGVSMMDYFSNEEVWYQCHLKAATTFPEAIFLPGFWSEFGMCTEPSAFGSRCSFPENEFPHAFPLIRTSSDIDTLTRPNPNTDGLLPFMLKRLVRYRKAIENKGYSIRFSVSRGPLNIASYVMGTTEFLMLIMMEPGKAHQLLRLITDFLIDWHNVQQREIDSIDGIFLLDDLIGFLSREQFEEFGMPYFKELYNRNNSLKFLHNDAPCRESAPLLSKVGVNIFNMGVDVPLHDLRILTGNSVILMGNLPPRDVLAAGDPEMVIKDTTTMLEDINSLGNIIPSCGGGMPPGVTTENIQAFISTVTRTNLP